MNTLLTGTSGRLGPHVVAELEAAGHTMSLFSRRRPVGDLERLPWIEGDITSPASCMAALKGGFDAVVHLAAQPYPTDHPGVLGDSSVQHPAPETTMSVNPMGTYYLLHAAALNDVGTFVMTGSNCALGHGYRISDTPFEFAFMPVDETHPSAVEDSYSYSKLAAEELLASYTRAYGMHTYAIRAAGICDAHERAALAEGAEAAQAWDPWLWSWVGSEDVASAHRLLMEQAADIDAHGVFFCNADDTTALEPTQELIETYRPELGALASTLQGHASFTSTKKLSDAVGWAHKTSWRS